MKLKTIFVTFILIFLIVGGAAIAFLFLSDNIPVLNPKGWVGIKQSRLLLLATCLMLIVVIPVFLLTFGIAWKYREENKKAKHDPEWADSFLAEAIWWGIPCVIIAVLGFFTWRGCHELDPFRPLKSETKALPIQVVALQWKWLFIYPEQGIATVNFVQFPENTPLDFEITSDAPMNSFWIPSLGGQIYAMSGMRSKVHLIANEAGKFRGSSANISGAGFSGMTFTAQATSREEFEGWVESVKASSPLSREIYLQLAQPSEYNQPASYVLADEGLFDWVIMKYMMP